MPVPVYLADPLKELTSLGIVCHGEGSLARAAVLRWQGGRRGPYLQHRCELSVERDVHLGIAAGRASIHGSSYFIEMQFYNRPLLVGENHRAIFPL